MDGWIKINRGIVGHWLWQDTERLKWWLDLILMAAWEEKKQLVGKQLISLRRGQLVASRSYLCARWQRSRAMVEPFLDLLEEEGMISKDVSRNISVITIRNYEKYQVYDNTHLDTPLTQSKSESYSEPDAHLDAHLDTHLDAHLDATIKENKEIKNNNIYIIDNVLSSEDKSSSSNTLLSESEISDAQEQSFAKEKFDWAGFVKFFNATLLENHSDISRLRSLSKRRKNALRARVREHGEESVMEVVRKAAASDFLNGKNKRGFLATFDWIFLPNNFPKVLDGNYDNKTKHDYNGNNNGFGNKRGYNDVAAQGPEEYTEGAF